MSRSVKTKYVNRVKICVLSTICILFIVILGSSCISPVPVTGGASNLKKGKSDKYFYIGGSIAGYDITQSINISQTLPLSFGFGLRYGISDVVDIEMMSWSGFTDIGIIPTLHFQLIDKSNKLKLCIRGLTSFGMAYSGSVWEFGGIPELIWGPNDNIYTGFRYEHRVQVEKEGVNVIPVLCFFTGIEEGNDIFRNFLPFFSVQFDYSQSIWQCNAGGTIHIKRKKKE